MNGLERLRGWFEARDWKPFDFQIDSWSAYRNGRSGIVYSATGTGKTLAAWGGPLSEALEESGKARGIKVLWITPLRALAADTERALQLPARELGLDWRIERRTGDTPQSRKTRQDKNLPQVLITTPESLSVILSREGSSDALASIELIVLDEWHELIGSKRGVQTELCLARVRTVAPSARTWVLSATIGNVREAAEVASGGDIGGWEFVDSQLDREISIETLVPDDMERFPWSGHVGLKMAPVVAARIDPVDSSLVFTNTRALAEQWYQALLALRPEWAGVMGVHHGSLSRDVREWVENGLRGRKLKTVVCTSSLDLGVDFPEVELAVQVGSPKGVGRMLQRAGRSGHGPGQTSRLAFVPTHALELVEIAATRLAMERSLIEDRVPYRNPLDVLSQHLITLAVGDGFNGDEQLAEVRRTHAFASISDEEWSWTIEFITRGGSSLSNYPEYSKVQEQDGFYFTDDLTTKRRHRLSIGTIVSDAMVPVSYMSGRRLGSVEESFISRLKEGDRFNLAGRVLELVSFRDNAAIVKRAHGDVTAIARWNGGRMPLSNQLSRTLRDVLSEAAAGVSLGEEVDALMPLLDVQARWSAVPENGQLLVERLHTRDGHHLFIYPFEGRLVHEGLAALLAHRFSRLTPITFSMAMNDYGLTLSSKKAAPLEDAIDQGLFDMENLTEDLLGSLNATEMSRRQFRDIARIAGLLIPDFPGRGKPRRQVQASSNLFFDVFRNYDPENMLLRQADKEVLERQMEQSRMADALKRIGSETVIIKRLVRPTPLAFPLIVDSLRDKLSSERLADRIRKMVVELEAAADER